MVRDLFEFYLSWVGPTLWLGVVSKSPAPDPAIGQAALKQAEIGEQTLQLGRDQIAYQREQDEKWRPMVERMVNADVAQADENRARATKMWDQFESTTLPMERRAAEETANYDSAGEIARRSGLAATTVDKQFDAAEAAQERELARSGVDPSSGRSAGLSLASTNARALGRAAAINAERENVHATGMALRDNVIKTGRGLPSLGLSADAGALAAGAGASGQIGAQAATHNAGIGLGMQGYGQAVNAYGASNQALLGLYQGKLTAAGQQQEGIGAGIGAAATVAAAFI